MAAFAISIDVEKKLPENGGLVVHDAAKAIAARARRGRHPSYQKNLVHTGWLQNEPATIDATPDPIKIATKRTHLERYLRCRMLFENIFAIALD